MTYSISEQDVERQQVLAQGLNPLTIPILQRLPTAEIRNILDLGCGQGNTSRMLAAQFPEAVVTGVEYDPNLVSFARAQQGNERIRFEQGDATQLPFPAGEFDLVFARYLLIHIPEPDLVIQEMFRMLRPGGRAVSFEADCGMDFTYPEHPCMTGVRKLLQHRFAQPYAGRQLVHRFRARKPRNLEAGACLGLEHEGKVYKQIYRMTAEAMLPGAISAGLFTNEEGIALVEQLNALEASAETIVVKVPDFWVIATV
jgi:SAM-dependent methyltransferase